MKLRAILVVLLALGVAGCGVKSDLLMPNGKPTPRGEKDPSKPPTQQQNYRCPRLVSATQASHPAARL